jgi:hypothetical protein
MITTPSQDRKLRGKLDGPNGDNEEQAREISGHQLQGTRMDPPQTGEEKMSDYDGGGFMGDGTKLQPRLNRIFKIGAVVKRADYSTFDIEDTGAMYQSRLNPPTQDQKLDTPTQDQKTNPPKLKASPEIVGRGENKQTGSPSNLPMSIPVSDQDWFNPPARDLKHDSDVATRDTGLGSGDTDDNPISEVEPQEPQDARVRQAKGLDKRGMAELWLKAAKITNALYKRADAVLEAGPEVFGREPRVSKFKMPASLRKAGSLDANPQAPVPAAATPDIFDQSTSTNPVLEARHDVLGIRRVLNIVKKLEKGRIPI